MAKKNKKSYKKSKVGILYIKRSKNKSYKVKKRGRLGKECIYFNDEKLTCSQSGSFCHSDNCLGFTKRKSKLSNYDENYLPSPYRAGTHERTNEYIALSKNIGTPMHVGYMKSHDSRRHKARCIYYNKETKSCLYYTRKCPGSSHCEKYMER